MRSFLALLLTLPLLGVGEIPPGKLVKPRPAAAINGDDGQPLVGVRLAKADFHTVVHGPLAQTTLLLTFANTQPRILGGNLIVPLPEGAAITGYGLEINGSIVDGVAVEKERARIIYESELHKRVDPGLVEHVEGNAFRTRLYPIPANGTRSIKIEYVSTVVNSDKGPTVAVPASFAAGADDITVDVSAPEAVTAGEPRGFSFHRDLKNAAAPEDYVVALPALGGGPFAVEKRPAFGGTIEELQNQRPGDVDRFENYFLISGVAAEPARKNALAAAQRVGIVWDASMSRGATDHGRELKLLHRALEKLGHPQTDLIVLRNKVEQPVVFGSGAAEVDRLIASIEKLPYDGATALGRLILPKNVADLLPAFASPQKRRSADYDMFLLFSDGLGNLGAERGLRAEAPVYAMSDEPIVNSSRLKLMTQESGGRYFSLASESDEKILAGIGQAPYSIIAINFNPNEIADVYPPVGTPVSSSTLITGKLLASHAKLTIEFGYGRELQMSIDFKLTAENAAIGSLIPRFWAQQKVAALSLSPKEHADELTRIGKQFNLVTSNTSLLVLETAEQYVQYHVVPPRNQPEIYKQFLAMIEHRHADEVATREQKIVQVAGLWNARVQWWDKQYTYPADLKVKEEAQKGAMVVEAASGGRNEGPGANITAAQPRPGGAHDAPTAEPRRPMNPAPGLEANGREAAAPDGASARTGLSPRDAADHRPVADQQVRQLDDLTRSGNQLERRADAGRGLRENPRFRAEDRAAFAGEREQAEALKKVGKDLKEGEELSIEIKPWDPQTPYIAAMKAVKPEQAYDVFLEQRKAYAKSPAFYLDSADYLVRIGQRDMGIRVLTDIVEMELSDARLLRIAAHRLMQIGQRELAIELFEKVLAMRPEEPQSYRDLAIALADRADDSTRKQTDGSVARESVDRAAADYSQSLELLNKVVMGNWPRFPEIELPVLMEANAIAARAMRVPGIHDVVNPIDSRLQKLLDLDVRVVMTWDADQTDIDLWVTEPSGEKCFYGHNRTVIGGLLSHDFTDGYGPEEYCLRKAMPGKYVIQANYYGSRQQELVGPATVQATVITNFGRPDERRQSLTLRLKSAKDMVDIGSITLGSGGQAVAEPAARRAE